MTMLSLYNDIIHFKKKKGTKGPLERTCTFFYLVWENADERKCGSEGIGGLMRGSETHQGGCY